MITHFLKAISERTGNGLVVVRRRVWLKAVREKPGNASSPNRKTKIAVVVGRRESYRGLDRNRRKVSARGGFKHSQRTSVGGSRLVSSGDILRGHNTTSCVAV